MGCRDASAPSAGAYRPRNPRASPLYHCVARHAGELRAAGRLERAVEKQAIERFVECGDPHFGFARIRCDTYCGWYSSRSRGARAARTAVSTNAASTVTEALSEYAQRAKAAWARLIRKVY